MQLLMNKFKLTSQEVTAVVICFVVASLFLLFPSVSVELSQRLTAYAIEHFDIFYIRFCSALVLLSAVLAISPLGSIKLGGDKAQPEFSFFNWSAMLFAAGMGSGLIFWGVAEPVFHYAHPPGLLQEDMTSPEQALALTYFHWGLHAWAIYVITGLVMAWFAFNKKRTMQISQTFSQSSRFVAVDYLAVAAVIFGVAGTLANSIALIQTGYEEVVAPVTDSMFFRVAVLIFISVVFTVSSVLGLKKGIARLSQFNLYLMLALLVVLIIIANPMHVLDVFWDSACMYVEMLPYLSTTIEPSSRQWSADWSVNYFIWWIAWAPFVGAFIAIISQGRTIRQFLYFGILLPTLTSMLWFSAFYAGVEELSLQTTLAKAINHSYTEGLFEFFHAITYGHILSALSILLLVTFVITSADSAMYVIGRLLGQENNHSRYLWSLLLMMISLALLYKNDIDLNRQVAVTGAIPYTLVLFAQVLFFLKSLKASK